MLELQRAFDAYIDTMDTITILIPKSHHDGISHSFTIIQNNKKQHLSILGCIFLEKQVKYECRAPMKLEIGTLYDIADENGYVTDLQIGAVIRTEEFDSLYAYDGDDLGFSYHPNQTIFKVWAPTAVMVKLRIYNQHFCTEYHMKRGDKGVWSYEIAGDCDGYTYMYAVCVNFIWRESTDPYSKAVTANSERSVVINPEKIPKISILPWEEKPTDIVIYEAHIRDLTIHAESGVLHKGKYLGLTEEAPISYIKELGVTHLQLMPFNDFGGIDELDDLPHYNWGYNPLHYNVPQGSYATDVKSPYTRIIEAKKMIEALHHHGIRVIMDVVYNHVYIREYSSFEQIVPGYYFRHDDHGHPSDGTGVGNDLASERQMTRKFILQSIMYWIQEFGIDGFRFDLMGISDIETMNEIRREVDKINPNIIILGEGWDLNTPLLYEQKAIIANAHQLPRIAHFNDRFRDTIKGNTFNTYDCGFALGDFSKKEAVKSLLAGSILPGSEEGALFTQPSQTINYVECHDNYTMWDKMSIANQMETIEDRRKRHVLATACVLLAQGIPFLHSGQEFFRTKKGIENSYNAVDEINELNWLEKEANYDTVCYIKHLIALRRAHGAFRLPSAELICKHMAFLETDEGVIGYKLSDVGAYGPWDDIRVYMNSTNRSQRVILEGEWVLAAEDKGVQLTGIRNVRDGYLDINPISVCVLFR